MRTLINSGRAVRLMKSVIQDLALDLRGMNVLTEAASGPFAVTPVLAALAGAERVVAIGRDSSWGTYTEVSQHIRQLATIAGCQDRIEISNRPALEHAQGMNIVTNLGFVRPIDSALISHLPQDAAIPLMWEPWEYRPNEIDLDACRARGIPVLGTNESNPRLKIFSYLPRVVEKLLLEREIEVERSRLLLIASSPFGPAIQHGLIDSGAEVQRIDPTTEANWATKAEALIGSIDAIVIAEHRSPKTIIGPHGLSPQLLAQQDAELIHLCGAIDNKALSHAGMSKHPARIVSQGVMTVTTDYVGPRPVIDLHAGGLTVGAHLVRLLRQGINEIAARKTIVSSGLGADFPTLEH